MQPEVQMYLHILVIVGVALSTPFIFKVFTLLGQFIVMKIWPVTSVKIEVKDSAGNIKIKTVRLKDSEDLIQTILNKQHKEAR